MVVTSAVASGSGGAAAEAGRRKDAMSANLPGIMAALRFGAVVLALAKP
jgi:hypothetical protein